jgi:hypothetical protein
MKHIISALILSLACGSASAHELTPTYPEFRRSFMDGISVTSLELYNAREEIQFYRIAVYDEEWQSIPFATKESTIRVRHNQRHTFEVYVKDSDLNRIEYICTISRLLQDQVQSQGVSSRVCSRVK